MFICHSALHQRMLNFFIPMVNKILDDKKIDKIRIASLEELKFEKKPLLQELADNKNYILKVILSWSLEQQKWGLQQNYDVNTPFGLIFRTPRSDNRKEKQDFLKIVVKKNRRMW